MNVAQERLKGLHRLVRQIHDEKQKNEPNVQAILDVHEELREEEKVNPYNKVVCCFSSLAAQVNSLFNSQNSKGSTKR